MTEKQVNKENPFHLVEQMKCVLIVGSVILLQLMCLQRKSNSMFIYGRSQLFEVHSTH